MAFRLMWTRFQRSIPKVGATFESGKVSTRLVYRRILAMLKNLARVIHWMEELPLMTLQRVMHLTFLETENWKFSSDMRPYRDASIFRHITWGPSNSNAPKVLSIIVQPPWILSPRDLELFVRCQAVSSVYHTCLIDSDAPPDASF